MERRSWPQPRLDLGDLKPQGSRKMELGRERVPGGGRASTEALMWMQAHRVWGMEVMWQGQERSTEDIEVARGQVIEVLGRGLDFILAAKGRRLSWSLKYPERHRDVSGAELWGRRNTDSRSCVVQCKECGLGFRQTGSNQATARRSWAKSQATPSRRLPSVKVVVEILPSQGPKED